MHLRTKTTIHALIGILAVSTFASRTRGETNSSSATSKAACYRLQLPGNPDATSVIARPRSETWCYQKLTRPMGATYIYNADGDKVRAELAMVIEADGIMTHGSLLAGQLTVHKVRAKEFNPFPVPLAEPMHLSNIPAAAIDSLDESARDVLEYLISQPSTIETFTLDDQAFVPNASSRVLPWRGYWFPYKSQQMSAVLRKYDQFVRSRTGSSPGASAWEASHHRYTGTWWEGHCNGWAASSVLRAQPRATRHDPTSGVSFSVSDQKGLLAETDFCSNYSFFGDRYEGGGDNRRDIEPALFHKTLTYYVGKLGKPVAMDYRSDTAVDNHIVSGYSMNMQKTGANTYSVTAKLRVHKYDSSRIDTPGVAPVYTRTYKYTLRTDAGGNPISGRWISENPDFLWVPLSPASCASNNPRLDRRHVSELFTFLGL